MSANRRLVSYVRPGSGVPNGDVITVRIRENLDRNRDIKNLNRLRPHDHDLTCCSHTKAAFFHSQTVDMNRWNTEKNFASRVGPCAYNVATSCRNAIWS